MPNKVVRHLPMSSKGRRHKILVSTSQHKILYMTHKIDRTTERAGQDQGGNLPQAPNLLGAPNSRNSQKLSKAPLKSWQV